MPDAKKRAAVCSEVAKLIHELREEKGLSMTELAAKSGLSRAMISLVEHEHRNPTLDTLLRIAAVLEVELHDMLRKATARGSRRNDG